jgi:hypothetical protein
MAVFCEHCNEGSGSIKSGESLGQLSAFQFLKNGFDSCSYPMEYLTSHRTLPLASKSDESRFQTSLDKL